jgi:ubiquinone biosynthesis protein COQ9
MKKCAPQKDKLIPAALRQMAFEGWNEAAFAKAESAEGFPAGIYKLTFPEGLQQFVSAFQEWVDAHMLAAIEAESDFQEAKVREKIFFCCMARLDALRPYREAVRRLIGHQLLPWNGVSAVRDVAHAADAMWKAAGDRSIDYNFYTKRMLLAGVYTASLQFWLTDDSVDTVETQRFLHTQLERVLKVGKFIGGLKGRFKKAA